MQAVMILLNVKQSMGLVVSIINATVLAASKDSYLKFFSFLNSFFKKFSMAVSFCLSSSKFISINNCTVIPCKTMLHY
jgi:hypothetical protein